MIRRTLGTASFALLALTGAACCPPLCPPTQQPATNIAVELTGTSGSPVFDAKPQSSSHGAGHLDIGDGKTSIVVANGDPTQASWSFSMYLGTGPDGSLVGHYKATDGFSPPAFLMSVSSTWDRGCLATSGTVDVTRADKGKELSTTAYTVNGFAASFDLTCQDGTRLTGSVSLT